MALQLPQTRAQQLARDVEGRIDRLNLPAGAPLGTALKWREESGYARTTVSEAVRLLVDRGVVEVRPGRGGGIFVATPHAVIHVRQTRLTVDADPTVVEDAIAIRDALEPLLARRAARELSTADAHDLRRALSTLQRAPDVNQFLIANWALHERIARVGKSGLLTSIYTTVLKVVADGFQRAAVEAPDDDAYLSGRLALHRDLVEAIVAGDEDEAATVATRHRE